MTLQHGQLKEDWFGQELMPALIFTIMREGGVLTFEASREAPSHPAPDAEPGKFTPELWKWDVAELFLKNENSGEYLELNLSPNAAWWACWFSAPRQPLGYQPSFNGYKAAASFTPQSWQARLSLPLQSLPPLENLTWNATAILESPQHRFLSFQNLHAAEPDFHRPEHFAPLIPRNPA